jgi:hypothetical protein
MLGRHGVGQARNRNPVAPNGLAAISWQSGPSPCAATQCCDASKPHSAPTSRSIIEPRVRPFLGVSLLLPSVKYGIIAVWVWAAAATRRQNLICSRLNSRQAPQRRWQANQNHCKHLRTSLQPQHRHLMRSRLTYRAHSGTSTMISLIDCLQQRSLSGRPGVAKSFPCQTMVPVKSRAKRRRLLCLKVS